MSGRFLLVILSHIITLYVRIKCLEHIVFTILSVIFKLVFASNKFTLLLIIIFDAIGNLPISFLMAVI